MADYITNQADQIANLTALNAKIQGAQKTRFKGQNNDNVAKTAKDFEAMVLSQMFSHMFTDIDSDGPAGGGRGEEIFRSFLIEEYGKLAAQSGKFGLSDHIQKHMIEMQASQSR